MAKLQTHYVRKGKDLHIEDLHIIQLLEANLNWVLKVIWGNHLAWVIHNLEEYDTSQSPFLVKYCSLTLCTSWKNAEHDVKECFDRVLPALVVVMCCRLGLPAFAVMFLFKMLRGMQFSVATTHGISKKQYTADADTQNPGQGSAQGSGIGDTWGQYHPERPHGKISPEKWNTEWRWPQLS